MSNRAGERETNDRAGLHAVGAQAAQRKPLQALGKLAAVAIHQQRQMREFQPPRIGAEGAENVDLHAGVGDVILAADDMGNAGEDVIDDAGEGVERRAVRADQHGV
jgi:signal transduction histidine kinase